MDRYNFSIYNANVSVILLIGSEKIDLLPITVFDKNQETFYIRSTRLYKSRITNKYLIAGSQILNCTGTVNCIPLNNTAISNNLPKS